LKKKSLNRKDAKYAKKKYNLSIAGFTAIEKASSLMASLSFAVGPSEMRSSFNGATPQS
jgi:hypothetical protein